MIALVPAHEVTRVWQDVAPLLQKAVDLAPGRYDVVDILTYVLQNEYQLWIGFTDEGIHSAGVTRIYDTPLARVFSILWLGGSNLKDWQDEALAVTRRFALDHGCTIREIVGREGWGRMTGFEKFSTTFQEVL